MPLFPPPPPMPWVMASDDINASAAAGTGLAANAVYLYVFELNQTTPFTGMKVEAGTISSGLTVDCGIYDSGGNLLTHASATTALTASQVNIVAFSATITLNPGRYIMACTPSNATDQLYRKTTMPSGMSRCYTATNNATAAVLPATTGTLVAAATCIAMQLVVSGGAP